MPGERPNVILLVVDTLRADHLSCYGYHRPTSPYLDQLAAYGTRFERCASQAPWTIPSFTTIMTGLFPERHRVVGSPWNVPNVREIRLDDGRPTLAEVFQLNGYTTVAVDNLHQMASHPTWFVRGYDHYINPTGRPGLYHHHVRASQVNELFLAWVDSSSRHEPFFAFLHYWDPHLPYNQPDAYQGVFPVEVDTDIVDLSDGRRYVPRWGYVDRLDDATLRAIAAYDAEIRYLDDSLRALVQGLEARGVMDDFIVAVTGDHGESMVEHDIAFDHQQLYEPTLHVPLIIASSDGRPGQTFNHCVQLVDVAPTLLDLARCEPGTRFDGDSLGNAVRAGLPGPGTADGRLVHAVQNGRAPARMIRSGDQKLIVRYATDNTMAITGVARIERYQLDADPYEVDERGEDAEATRLKSHLDEWLAALAEEEGLPDPLTESRLLVDFFSAPGDPELAKFYDGLGVVPGPTVSRRAAWES
jgi:arylsulfatase A-like enzyme